MSQFTIQSLIDADEWVPAQHPPRKYKSMAAAFKVVEQSIEGQDGGFIVRTFLKADTLTVFARANGFDVCWQIVPVMESPL